MSFVTDFLATRRAGLRTGCEHPAVSVRFEVGAEGSFTVVFRDGQAILEDRAVASVDHLVNCTAEEFRAIAEGRHEILGPFWEKYLPFDFFWAPSLYAFFFPEHPYLRLHPVLQSIYKTSAFYPTVTPFTQGYRLYELARQYRLHRTLEIGLAYGGSALFLAEAHRSKQVGIHYAADPFQERDYDNRAIDSIAEAGLQDYFTCLPVMGRDALRGSARAGLDFDLVYIDGDHGLPAVLDDFLNANAVLRSGGLLAFDDSHWPSGRRVRETIERHFPYRVLEEHNSDRFTVFLKEAHVAGPLSLRLESGRLGQTRALAGGLLHQMRRKLRSAQQEASA
jgi:predicted O-methyltransferase YrrM